MARFDKELAECENDLEKMLYIIKNGWRLQNQPQELRKEIFTRLLEACEIAEFDKAKRLQYDQDMYDEKRRNGELATARRLGREQEKTDIANRMLAAGLPAEQVMELTGLSAEEVNELQSR